MSQPARDNRELFHIGESYYPAIHVDEDLEKLPPLRLRALKGQQRKLLYRAMPSDKIETRADSGQVERRPSSGRGVLLRGWCSRSWATGALIWVFLGAMPLIYSYRGQFGELLIQLGQLLEAKPATNVPTSTSESVAAPAPQVNPQRQAASLVDAPIPLSSPGKLSLKPVTKISEPEPAELNLAAPAAETSPMSLMTSLPMPAAVTGPNLASLKPTELVEPGAVNYSSRDTRALVQPYSNSSAGKYFSVGKFKDELRVNQAINELEQLGFHASVVHSRLLWMNSYHILVGPYMNQGEVEAARNSLGSSGFNPRVLPSKSAHLSLPPMTLYGSDETIKDCVITWELNSPDATVEFVKGKKVVATSTGRWVKRDFEFKNDAIVSRTNESGPATLEEIQRAGKQQGFVLNGSELRVYLAK